MTDVPDRHEDGWSTPTYQLEAIEEAGHSASDFEHFGGARVGEQADDALLRPGGAMLGVWAPPPEPVGCWGLPGLRDTIQYGGWAQAFAPEEVSPSSSVGVHMYDGQEGASNTFEQEDVSDYISCLRLDFPEMFADIPDADAGAGGPMPLPQLPNELRHPEQPKEAAKPRPPPQSLEVPPQPVLALTPWHAGAEMPPFGVDGASGRGFGAAMDAVGNLPPIETLEAEFWQYARSLEAEIALERVAQASRLEETSRPCAFEHTRTWACQSAAVWQASQRQWQGSRHFNLDELD